MINVKISLITVSYNAADTLQRCIDSVLHQTYQNLEYIIIDGLSTDHTLSIINGNQEHIAVFRSEKDDGIYDAMNKGIRLATGDVIGTLNADDYFADPFVLEEVARAFRSRDADLLYADLDYVNQHGSVVRKWRSGQYRSARFNWGWMPPHPTFYAKKEVFSKWGAYQVKYGTSADYELMLRFMYLKNAKVIYLNKIAVKMGVGGVSNVSYKNRIKAWKGDFKAMKSNQLTLPLMVLVFKPLRKLLQFSWLSGLS